MIRETTEDLEREVERRVREVQDDPDIARRYDVTGDGIVDRREWDLVRRMVRLELVTKQRSHDDALRGSSRVGERVAGRFEVLGMLGRGGQGTTYLAEDLDRGGHVVVKQLSLHAAEHWKAIELFEREAAVLESLRHPRIPTYIDAFADETERGVRFLLIQEHVFGDDLEDTIGRRRWTADEAWSRLGELAEVLSYLHELHPPVIHRDVKPSNIVVAAETGALHLVDFGAAQNVAAETVGGSTVVGTSGYVPMEQYMGKATPASDIYALGATMVHCLTGIAPVDLELNRGRLQYESRIDDVRFVTLLGEMLQPFPEDRVPHGGALRQRMRELEGQTEAVATRTAGAFDDRPVVRFGYDHDDDSLVAAFKVAGHFLQPDERTSRWLTLQVDHAEQELVREITSDVAVVQRPLSAELHVAELDADRRRIAYQVVGVAGGVVALLAMVSGGTGLFAGPLFAALLIGTLWMYLQTRWTHITFDDAYVRSANQERPIGEVTQVRTVESALHIQFADGHQIEVALPDLEAPARVYLEQVMTDIVQRLKDGDRLDPTDVW